MMAAAGTVRHAALAWTLALASIAVLCAPEVASAAKVRLDSVTVTGLTREGEDVRIAVTSGPNGENPTGQVTFASVAR